LASNAALIAGLARFLGHLYPALAELQGRQGRRNLSGRSGRFGLAWRALCIRSRMAFATLPQPFRYSSLAALVASAVVPVVRYSSCSAIVKLALLYSP
jgi:glycerol-3-phosphate acyltransferase PlsY